MTPSEMTNAQLATSLKELSAEYDIQGQVSSSPAQMADTAALLREAARRLGK